MSVRILICDDDLKELEKLQQMLKLYGEKRMIPFEITACSAPKEITENIQCSGQFDILFLDIFMDAVNGMDLAKLVRRDNQKSRIVFVSTSTDHALDAFGVSASQYLVKPVQYSRFEQTMDALLQKELGEPFISVSTGTQVVKLFLRDFVYAETQRHYQAVCCSNGTTERFRINSAELFELLGGARRFVRVGASYIVNLDYVLRITPDTLELTGGHTVHIPRRALSQLKKEYFDYYCDREMEFES